MDTSTTELLKKKPPADPISTALGAADQGSQAIVAPPKNIEVKYMDLPDQKFPGPLSMIAGGIADTASFIANAPFDRSSRAEQNRTGLDSTAEVAAEQKRTAATGISAPPAVKVDTPPAVANGRDSNGVITADSANAAMGGDMQRSGGIFGTMDLKGANDIMARENASRGEMIDNMIKAQGGNGIGILGVDASGMTQTDRDNAEKTARWRQDDLIAQASKGNQAAVAAALNANAQTNGQQLAHDAAISGQGITARGQDIQAKIDATRLNGNPVDNALKQAQTQGIAATTGTSNTMLDLQKKAIAGDAAALATLRAINGKNSDDHARYMPATKKIYNEMGQVIGEDIVPFDKSTGQSVGGSAPAKQYAITADQRKQVEASLPKGMTFEQYAKQHNIVVK